MKQAAPDGEFHPPDAAPALTGGSGPVAVRVFPGLASQVPQARRWVRALASATCAPRAGSGDPAGDAELIAAELFANAVLHTRSGSVGGKVTVAVTADGVIHVHDHGTAGPCPGLSAPPSGGGLADFGRGLAIIAALSSGLAHLPAAWCPIAGPDDPAAVRCGCCTCCRPAALPPAPPIPAQRGGSLLAVTRESSVLR